jgi:GT2 family glycosyltransferase
VTARAEYYIERGGRPDMGPGFVPGNRSVAYKKSIWEELRGLPEDLTLYADDSVFGRQMVQGGYKMAYAPEALTYWRRPKKLKEFCKEQYNYGRGDGEAAIKTPIAFKWYKKGIIPKQFVPLFTGLRTLQVQTKLYAYFSAVKAGDITAYFMIPALLFFRGYSFGKGYLVGDAHGEEFCKDCRKRLEVAK